MRLLTLGLGHGCRTPLSKQRGVEHIPVLTKREDFTVYTKKFLTFCQDEPGCSEALRKAAEGDQIDAKIDSTTLHRWKNQLGALILELNRELHTLLSAKTEGVAWGLVDQQEGEGFEAWSVLHKEL